MIDLNDIIMAKKNNSIQIPTQIGFGFEVCDSQGNGPAFLFNEHDVLRALDLVQQASWVSVDVETTGLTDASLPVALGRQEWKQGASNQVRMRTIQVRVPTIRGRSGPRVDFAFDCDKLTPKLLADLSRTILSRPMFIAHNAGFDLYWLRRANERQTMPAMVVDSMLMTRLLRPKLVLKRAEMISSIKHVNDLILAEPEVKAAWKSIVSGASGGSLADVVLAMFGVVVDKTYQMPTNWTGLLGFEHYAYAVDDVIWADKIMANLLAVEQDGDLYRAYMQLRARKSTVRLVEPQVPELVLLREKGIPISVEVGQKYVQQQRSVLANKVDELISLEPSLEAHRANLGDPDAGLDAGLKVALATAFEARGVVLRKTEATGTAQVGEKDLRACRAVQMDASRPLFNAWVSVSRAKKSSNMAHDVVGFAKRSSDGRVHSLMSHGPVTGRLSASEPNCFTGDTEILTLTGWTRFDELSEKQHVAQYHQGSIDFVVPSAYIREQWAGNLVHNTTNTTDLLTTPKHRCLLLNRATGAQEVHEAQHYSSGANQLHAAVYAGGQGIWMADSEIKSLAKALTYASPQGTESLSAAEDSGTAHRACPRSELKNQSTAKLGEWLYAMTRAQLDLLLAELVDSSGGDLSNRETSSQLYKTETKQNAQWIQILCALSGKTAVMFQGDSKSSTDFWGVKASSSAHSQAINFKQTRSAYSGLVYCVSVDSGFIVVRRNGQIMVTGQCQQWPRDQIFRAMCISDTKPGCELTTLLVTEVNQVFLSKVSGHGVTLGDIVEVNSSWLAALFAADKYVPDWPLAEKTTLSKHIDSLFCDFVVASDFGALDVRVGAALCVRSQREMLAMAKGAVAPGPSQPKDAIVRMIKQVALLLEAELPSEALLNQAQAYAKDVIRQEKRLAGLKESLDSGDLPRNKYFQQRSEAKDQLLCVKMGFRFSQCLSFAHARGDTDYSALRDAFVADIDIHTFTGMKLCGRDPMQEFSGLTGSDRKSLERTLKKELGPRRQQGKIANLSLLYGMADAGFQEAAARGYDEHWSPKEAHDIRALWMNAYPEVELWHLWCECLQAGVVYLPEMGKDKPSRSGWWMAHTLSGRDIVAFGLNAALSYQDQSTGADILGLIMHELNVKHPHIFKTALNQVHDELVFCWPQAHHEEYLPIVETLMVECANSLTMPYGVPCAVSPACGPIWIKD